jgi:hypothetical protein
MNLHRLLILLPASLALALPAAASAKDYCVLPQTGCAFNNTYPQSAAGVQAALDAAASSNDADRVLLGAARYAATDPNGFAYTNQQGPLEIVGKGAGATSLGSPQGTGTRTLTFSGGANSSVHDLTAELPYRTMGAYPISLYLVGVTARDVTVVPDPTAAGPTYGSSAVLLGDSTLERATITLPTSSKFTAVSTVSADNTVRDTAITAALPLNIKHQSATLTRLRVVEGDSFGLQAQAGAVTLSDSTIVTSGFGPAVAASTDNGSNAGVALDHDTILGNGQGGSWGVYADAQSANGKAASVTLRNTILRNVQYSLVRGLAAGGGTATVTTGYSDYNPTTTTFGSGGSGAFVQGAGNVNVDPGFVNGGAGDYRLAAASPLVDAGDPAGLLGGEPSTDLGGLSRLVDASGGCAPRSDMGAFELQVAADKPTAKAAVVGYSNFDGSGSSEPKNRPLTYSWAFDDDASATGVSVSHTFASPGSHSAVLTVTDPCGRSDSATVTFDVAAAPVQGGSSSPGNTGGTDNPTTPPPGAGAAADTTPPVVSALKVRGKTLQFSLSERAAVTLTIGRKHARPLTRRASGTEGANAVRLRSLRPGRYALKLTATDAAGNTSTATTRLRVARR